MRTETRQTKRRPGWLLLVGPALALVGAAGLGQPGQLPVSWTMIGLGLVLTIALLAVRLSGAGPGPVLDARIRLVDGEMTPAVAFPTPLFRMVNGLVIFTFVGLASLALLLMGYGDRDRIGAPILALGTTTLIPVAAFLLGGARRPVLAFSPSGITQVEIGGETFVPWDAITGVTQARTWSGMPVLNVFAPPDRVRRRGVSRLAALYLPSGGAVRLGSSRAGFGLDDFERVVRHYIGNPRDRSLLGRDPKSLAVGSLSA